MYVQLQTVVYKLEVVAVDLVQDWVNTHCTYVLCKSINSAFPWTRGAPRCRDRGSLVMSSLAHSSTLDWDCRSAARTSLKSGLRWAWGCLQHEHTQTCSQKTPTKGIIQWKSYLILCTHYLMNVYIRICVYYIKVVCDHCNVLSNGHELPCLLYSMCLMRIHIYSELKWVCVAELTNRKSLQSTPCEDSQEVEPNGDQFEPIQQPADID